VNKLFIFSPKTTLGEGVGGSRGTPEEVPPTPPGPRCRKAPAERPGNGAETTRPPGDVDDAREGARKSPELTRRLSRGMR